MNLVPYLDIVTNVVIFLLATAASALALGNINVSAPRYAEPSVGAAAPDTPDKSLNLTVAITSTGFTIGSTNGILPKLPCAAPLQRGRCPAYLTTKIARGGKRAPAWVDKYDYKTLTAKLRELKRLVPTERQAILTADRWIPYQVVVRTMDTIRGMQTNKCTGDDGCLFDQVVLSAGVK